jgi:hypothetical protein
MLRCQRPTVVPTLESTVLQKSRYVAFNGPLDRCRPKNGVEELSDRNRLLAVPFLGDSFSFIYLSKVASHLFAGRQI